MYIKNVCVLLILILSCTVSAQSSNNDDDDVRKTTTQNSDQNEPLTTNSKELVTEKESPDTTIQTPSQSKAPASDSKVLATKKEPPDKPKEKSKSRTITVKNTITPEMTKYRFWGTYYDPTEFYLTIDDKKLKKNESLECIVNNKNHIEITYHYEFKNGMVTGSKSIEFEISKNKPSADITFSWKKDHRLICSSGRAMGSKKATMKSSCSFI